MMPDDAGASAPDDLHLADLSDWNPGANFEEYLAGGRPGVFIKATEGTGFVANTFAPYRAAAHAAGLTLVGLYHFARGGDAAAEAQHFLGTIGTLAPGEVAVLDAEVPGLSAAWCREWLSAVEQATGRMPLLYCSWSYWGDVLGSMTDCPLWIAAYHDLGHDDPRDSVPGCVLWQYTDAASVPGVGSADDSVFRGSLADLAALGGADSPAPPDPPKEPDVSKIAFPLEVPSGETRRVSVPAIGGGFGWTHAAVTFASPGVDVRRAVVGPNERPIPGLAPDAVASSVHFDGRGYVDLVAGDEWVEITLDPTPVGSLDLLVEASDAP